MNSSGFTFRLSHYVLACIALTPGVLLGIHLLASTPIGSAYVNWAQRQQKTMDREGTY